MQLAESACAVYVGKGCNWGGDHSGKVEGNPGVWVCPCQWQIIALIALGLPSMSLANHCFDSNWLT